ncbi:multiple epidermal growth factor-like domains protein 8 [Eurytemora carolleeae]|uniref:multiple epidermal growth factor-like domains protein 8 n=1 Tax=Eurytemora carolleeae TaxID=1294199 RepID=UPI000C780466|nr:multiple epidermal growth factor-like domains protein 8 [Eurytemora carolleeae]|eukprot:XP_023342633.1 multiple epidermal growth factor-like domains protein 8 [Eurytemora affinis]
MRKQQDLDLEVNDPAQLAWNFARCPLENECINDHHSCLSGSENCIDTIQGYRCECSPGFVRGVEGACKPVCERPCVHGTCVRPGECACGFGFTGPECDLVCLCNGNSNCQGPQFLDICIQCQNHTTGEIIIIIIITITIYTG